MVKTTTTGGISFSISPEIAWQVLLGVAHLEPDRSKFVLKYWGKIHLHDCSQETKQNQTYKNIWETPELQGTVTWK